MTVRLTHIAAAAAMAAALITGSNPASATTSPTSSLSTWLSDNSGAGTSETTTAWSNFASGFPTTQTVAAPIPFSLSVQGTIQTAVSINWHGAVTAAGVKAGGTQKSITINNFSSPTVTGFGFFLTDFSGTSTAFNITATDGTNTQSYPVLAGALTPGTSIFVGFSGLSGITSISVPGAGTGVQFEVGDFFETPLPVPEPISLGLLGTGLVGLGLMRRRKRA